MRFRRLLSIPGHFLIIPITNPLSGRLGAAIVSARRPKVFAAGDGSQAKGEEAAQAGMSYPAARATGRVGVKVELAPGCSGIERRLGPSTRGFA